MNTAKRIAAMFEDQGNVWRRGSRDIDDVCRKFAREVTCKQDPTNSSVKFVFKDDSVILCTEGGWDIGCPDCWAWPGDQYYPHDCDCPHGEGHDMDALGYCFKCDDYPHGFDKVDHALGTEWSKLSG